MRVLPGLSREVGGMAGIRKRLDIQGDGQSRISHERSDPLEDRISEQARSWASRGLVCPNCSTRIANADTTRQWPTGGSGPRQTFVCPTCRRTFLVWRAG